MSFIVHYYTTLASHVKGKEAGLQWTHLCHAVSMFLVIRGMLRGFDRLALGCLRCVHCARDK